jgi:DNA-binding CsgD family transcriptional regulator
MPLGTPLLDALERMGFGGLLLDTLGNVLKVNNTGARLLQQNGTARPDANKDPGWRREALKSLLRSRSAERFRMHEDNWIVLRRGEGTRPLAIRAVPIGDHGNGVHTILILYDLDAAPEPTAEALQKLFALTPAEARLALGIAAGRSPEAIAENGGVSISTVRKQLASVFAKTNTHRQSELAALLARVSILP